MIAGKGSDSGLHELLQCGLCGHISSGAKLLPCLHTFCLECLLDHWTPGQLGQTEHAEGVGDSSAESVNGMSTNNIRSKEIFVNCPSCEHKFHLPQGIPQHLKDNCLYQDVKGFENVNSSEKETAHQILLKVNNSNKLCQKCRSSGAHELSNNEKESKSDIFEEHGTAEIDTMDNCDSSASIQCYCASCDTVFMLPGSEEEIGDPQLRHRQHNLSLVEDVWEEKLKYLEVTLDQFQETVEHNQEQLIQLGNCHKHLSSLKEAVAAEIEDRAAHLIALIDARKSRLLKELEATCSRQEAAYEKLSQTLDARHKDLNQASVFSKVLQTSASPESQVALCEDVAARMHQLMQQISSVSAEVINLRLDVPELAKDDIQLDRAFGSLVIGTIQCGAAQCLKSFNIDLNWPTGLSTTNNQELVITGKKGAFEDQGQVLFYNRNGQERACHTLEGSSVPNDTTVIGDGSILVSDNCGQVLQFTAQGSLLGIMKDAFKGVGRLASTKSGSSFVVTSSEEKCLYIYDKFEPHLDIKNGRNPIPKCDSSVELSHPHYITTNSRGDIIVSDFQQHTTFAFSQNGELLFRYTGSGMEAGNMQCPSAVCCDSFDNVLIADFMHDRIHLVSRSGQFLGYLLSANNGVACPNFLTVDSDGHLFIGQYGGDINIFQYLSFMKHV